MSFTKLFSSLLDSTLWVEQPHHVVRVWVAMLAMADKDGMVAASLPGLARRACVTTTEAEEALRVFLSPDRYSRTPDNEGRRVRDIAGGWELLNYAKYRAKMVEDVRREKATENTRRYRADRASASVERAEVRSDDPESDSLLPSSLQSATDYDTLSPSIESDRHYASLSASGSGSDPDPDPGAPTVPGLETVQPGPLPPSRRERELTAKADALTLTNMARHEYTPGWAPAKSNQVRGHELGLTDDEIWARWESCRDKYYQAPFRSDVKQFNRELAWAKTDKEKNSFKSRAEREAFEMPGRERRAT